MAVLLVVGGGVYEGGKKEANVMKCQNKRMSFIVINRFIHVCLLVWSSENAFQFLGASGQSYGCRSDDLADFIRSFTSSHLSFDTSCYLSASEPRFDRMCYQYVQLPHPSRPLSVSVCMQIVRQFINSPSLIILSIYPYTN